MHAPSYRPVQNYRVRCFPFLDICDFPQNSYHSYLPRMEIPTPLDIDRKKNFPRPLLSSSGCLVDCRLCSLALFLDDHTSENDTML